MSSWSWASLVGSYAERMRDVAKQTENNRFPSAFFVPREFFKNFSYLLDTAGFAALKNILYRYIIPTDMDISEEEIIRRYGLRWNIEVYFKTCKQHLKLLQESNSPSFVAFTHSFLAKLPQHLRSTPGIAQPPVAG